MSSKFRPGTLSAYIYDCIVEDSQKPLHARRTDIELVRSASQKFKHHSVKRNSIRMYRSLSRKHAPASVEVTSSFEIAEARRKLAESQRQSA